MFPFFFRLPCGRYLMAPGKAKVACPYYGKFYVPSGLGHHKKTCKRDVESAAQEEQFRAKFLAEPKKSELYMLFMGIYIINVGLGSLPVPRFTAPWERDTHAGPSLVDSTSEHACCVLILFICLAHCFDH